MGLIEDPDARVAAARRFDALNAVANLDAKELESMECRRPVSGFAAADTESLVGKISALRIVAVGGGEVTTTFEC